jgi:hypothetical protein
MRTSPATQWRIIMHVEEVDHYRGVRYGSTVIGKMSGHTSAAMRAGLAGCGASMIHAYPGDLRVGVIGLF